MTYAAPLRIFVAFVAIVTLLVTSLAVAQYPGSKVLFAAFSFCSLILICSAFYRPSTFAYGYLVVFLWLGFWLKISVHLILHYPFVEAVGHFQGSPSEWDGVLLVAITGYAGVIFGRVAFQVRQFEPLRSSSCSAPPWYRPLAGAIWTILIALILICGAANLTLGIQQAGLVPRTILIWPLNALVYWLLNCGFALGVLTVGHWHLKSTGRTTSVAYLIILEACVSTVALLSRGQYIFHILPATVALLSRYRRQVSQLRLFRIFLIFSVTVVVFFGSLSAVNLLRGYYYSNIPVSSQITDLADQSGNKIRLQLLFTIDRWIGAEGVMAVSSFEGKSWNTLVRALLENSEIGKTTFYQEVSNSQYQEIDHTKYTFATLPGAVAFLYFSNSYLIVFVGMFALTIAALASEQLVSYLVRNPLICSFWGCTVANVIAQLGEAPRVLIPFFLLNMMGVVGIWAIQTERFGLVLRYLGLTPESASQPPAVTARGRPRA